VRDAMDKLYKPTPDGYCGDEDNGQTSAWYVFSAMGFYPVCPGSNEYVFGSPLFKKITIDLGKGNKFAIESPNNAPANVYIGSALLNGTPYNKNYINHFDIQKGGVLKFSMGSIPNKKRGVSPEAYPFSISKPSVK
jgi:putative alpha-1,2-mannosidase